MQTLRNTNNLPRWAHEVLASCPAAGKGVHNWLFIAALKLHPVVSDKDELIRMLLEAAAHCGREVSEVEVANAVLNSARVAGGKVGEMAMRPPWPLRSLE